AVRPGDVTAQQLADSVAAARLYTNQQLQSLYDTLPLGGDGGLTAGQVSNIVHDTADVVRAYAIQQINNYNDTVTKGTPITGNESVFDSWDKNAANDFTWDFDYGDLINQPTIPTNNNQLTNGAGYITNEVDGSTTNELQTISKTGLTVTLSNGGGSFNDDVNDADNSPTNEIQTLSISNDTIRLTSGGFIKLPASQGLSADTAFSGILNKGSGSVTAATPINIALRNPFYDASYIINAQAYTADGTTQPYRIYNKTNTGFTFEAVANGSYAYTTVSDSVGFTELLNSNVTGNEAVFNSWDKNAANDIVANGSNGVLQLSNGSGGLRSVSGLRYYTPDNYLDIPGDIYMRDNNGVLYFSEDLTLTGIWSEDGAISSNAYAARTINVTDSIGLNGVYITDWPTETNKEQIVDVVITQAQWRSLNTNPVQLLPAPGSGLFYYVHSVLIKYTYNAADTFTHGENNDITRITNFGTRENLASDFRNASQNIVANFGNATDYFTYLPAISNTAITLSNTVADPTTDVLITPLQIILMYTIQTF
ncbi:MAG: hypothetical protein HC896_05500, partial [Bacteroidales bacterium]|nr:hypothetical protein [Bacteroidales bacterium]